MAKYRIWYSLEEEEYNNIENSLPSHKVLSPINIAYWIGGDPKDKKNMIVIEITKPIDVESEDQAVTVVEQMIKQGMLNPKNIFYVLENDNIIYTNKDFREKGF